jgi:hypothetical protein
MGMNDEKIPSDDGVEDELASPFDTTFGRSLLLHRDIECFACGHTVGERIGRSLKGESIKDSGATLFTPVRSRFPLPG